MKIRTRVKLAGIITVCVFLAYGVALVNIDRTMSHLARDVRNANEFGNRISLLRTLTLDYLLYRTERAQSQWLAVFDELRRLLDNKEYRELQREYVLGDIGDKVKIAGDTFKRLMTIPQTVGRNDPEAELRSEFRNRLATQLLLTTQDLRYRFVNLGEEVNQRLIRTLRLLSLLNISALFALGLIVISAGVFLQRSVVRPVLKLREGTEIIGAGNLDYKVGLNTRDEVGELSQAFDRMTANLRQVTVSRDELMREIEERQRAEERLQQTLLDLERSNQELEEFAYVASHDLQEPLRKMANFSEMLANRYQGQLDDRANTYLGYVADGAKRMKTLINDLLAFSRVGRADFTLITADMNDILEKTLNDIQPLMREKQATITHEALPTLKVNPYQMGQLLQNLITNAIKFHGNQPPRIHLSARQEGQEWVIAVSDNGIGFASQYAEHIFKVFQRLHTKEEYPGTGIGLAICKKIVERHGGRIWAEAEPGQGATFYFTVPV